MFNFFGKRMKKMMQSRSCSRLSYNLVSFERAKQMIDSQEVVLIDVRSKKEYDSMHIVNAINIPLDELKQGKYNLSYECKIMPYCSTGTRTKAAIEYFNRKGFSNVYIWEYAAPVTFPYTNMLVYNKENI